VVAASATKSAASFECPAISGGVAVAMARPMTVDPAEFNDITRRILAGAIEVHRTLGPGLLESIYTPCLHAELTARQLGFVTQRAIQIVYKGIPLESSYRVDLIVEELVVVELKSTTALLPVHQAQVLTYLEITKCPAGLLINFNVPRLMDGVKRMINPRATIKRGEP
jgi:GxxExxY protein